MMEITQEDREAAAYAITLPHLNIADMSWFADQIRRGLQDDDKFVQALAAHRIAAEQAVLAKLRDLPDDAGSAVMQAVNKQFGWELMPDEVTSIAEAFADALEQKS